MVRPCGKKAAIRRRSRTSGGRFVANGEISALELLIDQTVVETIRSEVNEEHLRREVWFSLEDLITDVIGPGPEHIRTVLVNDEPALIEDTSIEDFIQGKQSKSLWAALAAYDTTAANVSRNTTVQRRCRARKRRRQLAEAARSCSKITNYFKPVFL